MQLFIFSKGERDCEEYEYSTGEQMSIFASSNDNNNNYIIIWIDFFGILWITVLYSSVDQLCVCVLHSLMHAITCMCSVQVYMYVYIIFSYRIKLLSLQS